MTSSQWSAQWATSSVLASSEEEKLSTWTKKHFLNVCVNVCLWISFRRSLINLSSPSALLYMTISSKQKSVLNMNLAVNVSWWCHRVQQICWTPSSSLSRLSCRSLKTKTGGGDWPRASGWVSAASRRRWWSRSPEYWGQSQTGVNITDIQVTEYSVIRLLHADWAYCLRAVTSDLWPLTLQRKRSRNKSFMCWKVSRWFCILFPSN